MNQGINITQSNDANPFGHVGLWPNDKFCMDRYNFETFEKDLCFQHCDWGIDEQDSPGYFFGYRECATGPSWAFQWHAGIANFSYLVWWLILLSGWMIIKSTKHEAWVVNPADVNQLYFNNFWTFLRKFGP